ncbi:MAG: hypothetical protein ABI047_03185 [Jatrophihabitantaceae bacterium]
MTPRRVFALLAQVSDDSAFVASLRGTPRELVEESPLIEELRNKRRHRGWGTDRELLARVGDLLAGNRFPRPSDDGVTVGGRQVWGLDDLASSGF